MASSLQIIIAIPETDLRAYSMRSRVARFCRDCIFRLNAPQRLGGICWKPLQTGITGARRGRRGGSCDRENHGMEPDLSSSSRAGQGLFVSTLLKSTVARSHAREGCATRPRPPARLAWAHCWSRQTPGLSIRRHDEVGRSVGYNGNGCSRIAGCPRKT